MARHLVTSALPYINGTKHLGNLIGSLLPADVYARWLRQQGHDVTFVCGTDDHGAPAELAAAAAGLDVRTFCDTWHATQAEHYRQLGLSFDRFGRTSNPEHHRYTQYVYQRLVDRGLVERRTVAQLYSPTDQRFLADRYVRGTCPHCGRADARGDQCEACGRLLDPTELLRPESALSGATDLELRESTHAFLRLSALQPAAEAFVADHAADWTPVARQVAESWLATGLHDRCITRDLAWGVPVPDLPGKVFWCWFDAPLAYVSLAPEPWDSGAKAAGVQTTQFLGKDNAPFHTVWLPAILEAIGVRQPSVIHALHWLNWYGERFSTSAQRGIFLDEALALHPADVWRWALLAQCPETEDSRFTWEQLAATVNKDLAGQLGNFVHRVQKLAARRGATIPGGGEPGTAEAALQHHVLATVDHLADAQDQRRLRAAVEHVRTLLRTANRYIDAEAPWALVRTDPDRAEVVLRTCFQLIRLVAAAVTPLLPTTAGRLFDAVQATAAERAAPLARHAALSGLGGRPLVVQPPLFARIEAAAGTQCAR